MEFKWVEEQFSRWKSDCLDYKERAFLEYCYQWLQLQQRRIEIQKGQLDGKMWSPKEW